MDARSKHFAAMFAGMRKRYEGGDKGALLEAVNQILIFREEAPEWVLSYFNSSLTRFWRYEAVSLDEAFGVARSKDPRSIAAGKRSVKLIGEVTQHIWAEQTAGKKLNEDFFEQVGEKFFIGKTMVKKYWRIGNAAWGFQPKRRRIK